jgi:hypothetical protein
VDRSQTRLLVVLAGVLAGITGVLWWQGKPTTAEHSDATEQLWSVDREALRRLEIDRIEGRLVFEHRDGAWWMLDPAEALADGARVEDLAGQLAALQRAVPVEAAPSEAFGLGDPPAAHVTWIPTTGAPSSLTVGIRAPAAYSTYVLTAAGGVGAANGDPTGLLHAPADDFRDRKVFRFAPEDVRSVRITYPEHVLDVRGRGLQWHLAGYGRADPDRVDDLVMDLLDIRFDTEDPAVLVDAPRVTVEVELEGGSVDTLSLGVSEGYGFPARSPDGRTGRVFDGVDKSLSRGPTDVGQRTAFLLRPEVADRVRFEGLGKVFEATRQGPDWSAPPLDAASVYDRVLALSNLAVERTLDPAGPSDPPEATVTIHEPAPADGGEPTVSTFVVGPALPDGSRTVRDPAGPGPGVRVSSEAFEALVRDLQ